MKTKLHKAAFAALLLAGAPATAAAPGDVFRISEDATGNPGSLWSDTWRSGVNHISADGRYVAFYTAATNLIGDPSPMLHIMVHDRITGTLELVSRKSASAGGAKGNYNSYEPSISTDGRYVAFYSFANNLDSADTDYGADVYVYDRDTDTLELVSRRSAADGGAKGNDRSLKPSISADGRYVAFESLAWNLDSSPGLYQVLHIYVYDRVTDTLELVSRKSASAGGTQGNGSSEHASISANGRYVAFQSYATNLDSADTDGNVADVYVYDRDTDTVELVSRQSASTGGVKGNQFSANPTISADGRYVAFRSNANNLDSADTDMAIGPDIYVYDRDTDTVELVSRKSASTGGAKANASSVEPSISANGRYVAFQSTANNLDPTDPDYLLDVYVYDRLADTVHLMSKTASGIKGDSASFYPTIAPDGSRLAFNSYATSLDGAPPYNQVQAFVKETGLPTTAPNQLPTANAGMDQTVEATSPSGASVNLDGSASFDPDAGDSITVYAWNGPFGSASGVSSTVSLPLGTQTVTLTVTDAHGATDDDTLVITVADTTPPTVTCPANVTVTVGQAVNLGNPTVSDNADASPAVSNNAPANYAAGPTTVTWSATDEGGNSASCAQVVTLTYHFQGFFQPVDNPPSLNSVKSGATVPVKWRLLDAAGNYLSDTSTVTDIRHVSSTCGGTEDAIEETVPAGGTGLRWDSTAQQFIYNWKTPSLPGKCLRLDVRFADGSAKSANFKLK